MRARACLVVLAAVALGGCGGGEALSARSADRLHAQVATVRHAAQKDDRARALHALDAMEREVRDLRAAGSLAPADADALRRGIGRARRRVRAEIAEPTPAATGTPSPTATATATPVPTATPQQTEPPKGQGKGKAKGKKGKGG